MISSRYAPVVCALVGLALVPTFIHSYAASPADDGRHTDRVPALLAGYASRASDAHNETWGQRRFESFDWTQRLYTAAGDEVTLTVVRSYDPKSLYHHPELAVAEGEGFAAERIMTLPHSPEIPLHVLHGDRENGATALYVLHYADRFVADPIPFQLRIAGQLLVTGRQPMTLFFVLDEKPSTTDVATLPATELLLAAVDAFVNGAPAAR